jgi:hypothetical protein
MIKFSWGFYVATILYLLVDAFVVKPEYEIEKQVLKAEIVELKIELADKKITKDIAKEITTLSDEQLEKYLLEQSSDDIMQQTVLNEYIKRN